MDQKGFCFIHDDSAATEKNVKSIWLSFLIKHKKNIFRYKVIVHDPEKLGKMSTKIFQKFSAEMNHKKSELLFSLWN